MRSAAVVVMSLVVGLAPCRGEAQVASAQPGPVVDVRRLPSSSAWRRRAVTSPRVWIIRANETSRALTRPLEANWALVARDVLHLEAGWVHVAAGLTEASGLHVSRLRLQPFGVTLRYAMRF
jgi:hypothetical protein